MLIAHLSDTHITEPGRKACGVANTNAAVARCVARINGLHPRPDLALVTGDITNDGTLMQMREAARILAALDMPFRVVPGNHDDRAALLEAFAPEHCAEAETGHVQFTFDHADVRFIALDSSHPGTPGGVFGEDRARWLEAALEAARGRRVIILLHHPPLKFGVLETDADGFEGAERLAELVRAHGNVERVLCGHIHLDAHAGWAGTVVSTAPAASGMRLALDLTMTEEPAFVLDDGAFLLHQRTADGGLATHCLRARADAPRHPFHSERGLSND